MRKAGGNVMYIDVVKPGNTAKRQDIINKLVNGIFFQRSPEGQPFQFKNRQTGNA